MFDLIQNYGKNPYIFDDGSVYNWAQEPPLELCNYLPLWDIRIVGEDDMRYNYGDLDFEDDRRFNYPDYNDIDYRMSENLVDVEGGDTNVQTHIDIDRGELDYGDPNSPLLVMDFDGGCVDEQAGSLEETIFYYQDQDELSMNPGDGKYEFQDQDELAAEPGDNRFEYEDVLEAEINDKDTGKYNYEDEDSSVLIYIDGGDENEGGATYDTDVDFNILSLVTEPTNPDAIDLDGGDEDAGSAVYTDDMDFDILSTCYDDAQAAALDIDGGDEDTGGYTYNEEHDFTFLSTCYDETPADVLDVEGGYVDEQADSVTDQRFSYQDISDPTYFTPGELLDVDGDDADEQYAILVDDHFDYPDEDDPDYVEPDDLLDFEGGDEDTGGSPVYMADYDFNEISILDYSRFYDGEYDFHELAKIDFDGLFYNQEEDYDFHKSAWIDFDQFYDSELDAWDYIYPDPIDPAEYTEEYDFNYLSVYDTENPYEYLVRDVDGGDADEQLEHENNHQFDYEDHNDPWYVEPENLVDLDGGDTNEQTNEPDDGQLDFGDVDELIVIDMGDDTFWYQDVTDPDYEEPTGLIDIDAGDMEELQGMVDDGLLDFGDVDVLEEVGIDYYSYQDEDDQYYVIPSDLRNVDGLDENDSSDDEEAYTEDLDFDILSEYTGDEGSTTSIDIDGGDEDEGSAPKLTIIERFSYRDENDSDYVESDDLIDIEGGDLNYRPEIPRLEEYDFNDLCMGGEITVYVDRFGYDDLNDHDYSEDAELVDVDGGDPFGTYLEDLDFNELAIADPESEKTIIIDADSGINMFSYKDMDDPDDVEAVELVDVDGGDESAYQIEYNEEYDMDLYTDPEYDDPTTILDIDAENYAKPIPFDPSVYTEEYDFNELGTYTGTDIDTAINIDGGDLDEEDPEYDMDIDAEEYAKLLPIDPSEYTEDYDLNTMCYIPNIDDFYNEDLDFNTLLYNIPEEYANIYAVTAFCIARILEDEIIKRTGDYKANYEVHNMDIPEVDAYMNVHIGINPRMHKVYVEFLENWRLKILMGSNRKRLGQVITHRLNRFFELTSHIHTYHVEIVVPEDEFSFCCDTTDILSCHTIQYWKSIGGHHCFLEDREEVKLDIAKKGWGYNRKEFYDKVHKLNMDYAMDTTRQYMVPEVFEQYRKMYKEEFGYYLPDLYDGYIQIALKYDLLYREDMYGKSYDINNLANNEEETA